LVGEKAFLRRLTDLHLEARKARAGGGFEADLEPPLSNLPFRERKRC
jgi:hypothetical protein